MIPYVWHPKCLRWIPSDKGYERRELFWRTPAIWASLPPQAEDNFNTCSLINILLIQYAPSIKCISLQSGHPWNSVLLHGLKRERRRSWSFGAVRFVVFFSGRKTDCGRHFAWYVNTDWTSNCRLRLDLRRFGYVTIGKTIEPFFGGKAWKSCLFSTSKINSSVFSFL